MLTRAERGEPAPSSTAYHTGLRAGSGGKMRGGGLSGTTSASRPAALLLLLMRAVAESGELVTTGPARGMGSGARDAGRE
jgi:hypothetical protein